MSDQVLIVAITAMTLVTFGVMHTALRLKVRKSVNGDTDAEMQVGKKA